MPGLAVAKRFDSEDRLAIPFRGFSMYPFLRPGDLLLLRKFSSNPLRVGDVVLFRSGQPGPFRDLIAHRVIRITSDGRILTKGDNLPRPDPVLEDSARILGQVILVLRRDRLIPLTRGPLGFAAKWIALLSRKNVTPGILAARMKDWTRRNR